MEYAAITLLSVLLTYALHAANDARRTAERALEEAEALRAQFGMD